MHNKCHQCDQLCCKYITIKLQTPKTLLDFDNLYWYLVHEKINVFQDRNGWYALILNECKHMKNGKCNIYEKRSYTCRQHSNDSCEHGTSISDGTRVYFRNEEDLNKYCLKKFKTWKNRYNDLED